VTVNRNTAWQWMLAFGLAAIVGYYVLPGAYTQDVIYSMLGTSAVVAILVGVHLHRPSDRVGWNCLAASGACFTLGDDILTVWSDVFHTDLATPSGADALYLLGYPFLVVGIIRLTRGPSREFVRENVADAAVVTLGVLALSWDLLMDSYVHDGTLSVAGTVVNMAYPMMDILVIFFLVRSFLVRSSRQPFQTILTLAVLVMFVADFAYDVLSLHNATSLTGADDGLYLVSYVLMAAAGLHPSVAAGTTSAPADLRPELRRGFRSQGQLPLVIAAGFIPPAILLIKSVLGVHVNVVALSCLCIAVFGVICLRLNWMLERIGDQSELIVANALDVERKVTELERAHQHRDQLETTLRYQAFHDELTGLANRALLHDRVEQALGAIARRGESVALCLGDLDGFKTINDTLGHFEGDRVLRRVAELLGSIVRPGDTVARLGGDEFAVLMLGVESERAASEFAKRMVALLRDSSEVGEFLTGISVGVTVATPTTTVEQLFSEADTAMYAAKAAGKNRVAAFEPHMRDLVAERMELISAFQGSLERAEFVLEFQPVVTMEAGRLRGFEALVRWNHPTRGWIGPQHFIPLAEETGFIVPLGRWIMMQACAELARWSEASDHPIGIAINISRRQLASSHLVADLRSAVQLAGVPPGHVELEVTESALINDPAQATSVLTELRALGFRIAIDDFGTGYSSLSYLQTFPVDVLKIDKSFIDALDVDLNKASALIGSIIDLAHALDLRVVAEGIEADWQRLRLARLHCDYGQGYFFSRPLSDTQAAALVQQAQLASPTPGTSLLQ
jgi:diguanylate cyclase